MLFFIFNSANHSHSEQTTQALFKPISARGRSTKDALEEYLNMPVLDTVKDPVAYWDSVLCTAKGNRQQAALARMALDFLTIPGALRSELYSL